MTVGAAATDGAVRPLVVLSSAAFLAALDLSVVDVAFEELRLECVRTTAEVSGCWNAYAIVYAALLVPLGRLADRRGHRAFFP